MRFKTTEGAFVWGAVVGVDHEYPGLLLATNHDRRLVPGMLVTCYEGTLDRMREEGFDRPGLGIVIAVKQHPSGINMKATVTVVWNW